VAVPAILTVDADTGAAEGNQLSAQRNAERMHMQVCNVEAVQQRKQNSYNHTRKQRNVHR